MKKHSLQGQKRENIGRKVSQLRRMGNIPATVYGKKISSVNLTISLFDFVNVFREAGETGLVELTVEGKMRPVLIHHVQKDPVKDTILHVEFYQVDLKEKVKAAVPLILIGESPAVSQKLGVLLTLLTEIEVEALPTDLPEKIEVDVSLLSAVDQEIKVAELSVPAGVTVLSDGSVSVVKVGSLVSREAEAQAAQEAAQAAEATTPAEGETKETEEGATEEKGEDQAGKKSSEQENTKAPPNKEKSLDK